MYFHSVEGVVPRKKIRLRIYNNENKQLIANAGAQCQHSVDYNNTAVKRNCGNCSSSPWWKFWEKKKKSSCNIKS